jgi:hypothetical protein
MKILMRLAAAAAVLLVCAGRVSAQSSDGWHWMADGVIFANLNHQSTTRGETQLRSQNWLMASGSHKAGGGQLFVSGMLSLEPVTLTARGYSQLFQMGEAYQHLENTDRQHPHDMFSQLVAGWRVDLGSRSALTIFGAPVGEATLGPVAFMHRLTSSENPTAPLAHHTLDSTHIAQGVVGAAFDVAAFTVEGSAFHGREPDEHRYGITPGKLDSWATRVWFRPSSAWVAQASYGYLHQPEELEPGNIKRTTGSVTWTRQSVDRTFSVTAAVGHNKKTFTDLTAFLGEALARFHDTTFYLRGEWLDIETEHLLFPTIVHKPHPGELIDQLGALTVGGVHDVVSAKRFLLGVGADFTVFDMPRIKRVTGGNLVDFYGTNPYGVHVFARLRPRGGVFMRMWNMTMTEPMRHSSMTMR